jgi:hydroxypyruvate isomerase
MMKLSLSMWSVHRTVREKNWTVYDFLSFCKEEGIDHVELLNVFWKDPQKELEDVIRFVGENQMEVTSYAVGNDFVSESAEVRQAALQEIIDAIPIAQKLGTSIIRVFSGSLSDEITYDTALDWIVTGLVEASKFAEKEGIVLCLENHGKLAGSGEQVKQILERVNSKALRSTFDTGNFLLVDEAPIHAIEVLLPYIGHVHLKDFKESSSGHYQSLKGKSFEGVAAGQGDVHLDSLIRKLQHGGYSGVYVLEYEGLGSEAEGIRKSYDYLRTLS